MKKLLIFAFLAIGMIVNAQIKFVDEEYFTASMVIDPNASIKEKGANLVGEVELVSNWKYVKFNTQSFTALEGGYIDIAGGFGVNITSGYFNKWRAYSGIRLGFINRGKYTYPLAGTEVGLDIKINKTLFIRLRTTYDQREDFQYSSAKPSQVLSNYVGIGTRF
jgi:hypothetical protein